MSLPIITYLLNSTASLPGYSSETFFPFFADELPENVLSDSLKHPDYFGVNSLFTVRDLFDARVHYGHKDGSLNDKMKPFLYGSRLGHNIFDLDITAFHLRQALNFCAHIAFRDGIILFVCRNSQFTQTVEKTAEECKEFAHTRYWRNGTFTNSTRLFGAVTRLPDLCIFLSTFNELLLEHPGIVDAAKLIIPSIAIVDSNSNPSLVTYPIPGNDDSPSSVQLYCKLFKQAIIKGKVERLRALKQK